MPYQATPLGRFNVSDRPRPDLIGDLEAGDWLERVRRLVGNRKMAPARARQAMRRLEDALFQMTSANRAPEGARNALMALGSLVGWLATNANARKACKPPPVISSGWIRDADDGSAEFRIAAALAGLGLPAPEHPGRPAPALETDDRVNKSATASAPRASEMQAADVARTQSNVAPPMAAHLAPLNEQSFFYRGLLSTRRAWSDGNTPPTVVWGAGGLVSNMVAVMERRLLEAAIRGLEDKPLAGAAVARLADVAAFLFGDFDDARCAALLAGLVWARPARLPSTRLHTDAPAVPFAYAALKPVFTPDTALRGVGALTGTTRMPIPSGLVSRLRTGGDSRNGRATDAAVRIALARARASGLPSPFDPAGVGARSSRSAGGRIGAGIPADRLAAALLIPVSDMASTALLIRVYPGDLPEGDNLTTEDTTNAA